MRQSNEIRLRGSLVEESFYLVARKGKKIIMFARTKGPVHYNIRSIFLSTNNKSVMLQIFTLEEKQKYHITFFCENNKSIILHHVLLNSPESVFLWPLLF